MSKASRHCGIRGDAFWPVVTFVIVACGCFALQWFRFDRVSRPQLELNNVIASNVPALSRPEKYVSSNACRRCHPGEYHSWHRTFHRTMTQLALPENVLGEFDGTTVESGGLEYRVYRKGDTFWASMPDPDMMLDYARGNPNIRLADVPQVERQVFMTTGSHHYQTYWVASEKFDTVMNTLPLVYLPVERQWIPREAAFMTPPDDSHRLITIWNDHCINCHSTGANPGVKGPKQMESSVGELGISCEACHGPGERHVAINQDPLRRYRLHASGEDDRTIVNPKKINHRRSSEICGQCHGVYIRTTSQAMKFAKEGVQYRPGENLHAYRHYIEFPDENASTVERKQFRSNREFYRQRWWDDGSILAAGREYTAIRQSGCFQRGEMSCLSCHSMHDAEPNDQLSAGMRASLACTQCHADPQYTTDVTQHTHHFAESTGSNCLNCHMPHTSYALFNAIRNHTITSPDLRRTVPSGVPNACNLCHLEKTLDWTQQHLGTWYGQESVKLTDEQQSISAAVLWLLKGHAAQRAIAAWHFGWKSAQQVSPVEWMEPLLAQLLKDPYGVVRNIAGKSLRDLSRELLGEYHFTMPQAELAEAVDRAVAHWKGAAGSRKTLDTSVDAAALLLDEGGLLREDAMRQLLSERDDRPVSIKE